MDADRVRSYLQVACAGLGFDIGEVWLMSNDSGASAVTAIGKMMITSCALHSLHTNTILCSVFDLFSSE